MRILQPADWPKPRGFSHGVALNHAGRWIVLAGQTGGDEKGDYQPDMAAQVGTALRRIVKLLAEAGAGPEHIVRLTWYLTSRSEYQSAGAGIGAASRETLRTSYRRVSAMLAPLNWPAALMTMDCRLPYVASERLAVKPGAFATT